ncbi:MAG: SIS domain-containing protein [Porticoccaceae bacterium]|nr:SIS domain-containing protein [Porticoccaceae bacterium]
MDAVDQKVFSQFQSMIEATMATGETCAESIGSAAEKIASALLAGNRVFTCGEHSSSLVAQLLTDYLSQGYEIDRPGFPSLNLNQIAQQSGAAERYNQALKTQAASGDILVLLSGGDNSNLLLGALNTALDRGMSIVLISTENDDLLINLVSYNDVHINIGSAPSPLIIQSQVQIVQCLCALIDSHIFGGE